MVLGKLRSLLRDAIKSQSRSPVPEGRVDDKAYTIDAALRDHFAPTLRRSGFKGSGRHFRRVVGDVFQAVNVQGSLGGGMFAVNLGLHPLSIPVFFDEPLNVKKARELDCEFRQRLSETTADRWWSYSEDRASTTQAAASAAGVFEKYGLALFEEQSRSTAPLYTMTPEQFDQGAGLSGFGNTGPRMALALARLRRTQGKFQECRDFASIGLRPIELPDPSTLPGGAIIFDPGPDRRWRGQDELEILAGLPNDIIE